MKETFRTQALVIFEGLKIFAVILLGVYVCSAAITLPLAIGAARRDVTPRECRAQCVEAGLRVESWREGSCVCRAPLSSAPGSWR